MDNQIGIVSCHLEFETIEEAYDKILAFGCDAVEWFERRDLYFSDEQRAATIRELSSNFGIQSSYHAFYYDEWDLAQQEREGAVSALKKQIECASKLGANLMTIHLGTYDPAIGREVALKRTIQAIGEAASAAEKGNIVIAVENFTLCHGSYFLGEKTEDFELLFREVTSPSVGLNLDIGHANITKNLHELLSKFPHRLCNIHLHDTDGETDGHQAPGQGTVDWDSLFRTLKSIRYNGPIHLEFPETSGMFSGCISMIRSR